MSTKLLFTIILCLLYVTITDAKEKLKFGSSIILYRDLSDTYGKGNSLTGSISVYKNWYGASIDIGYYQAQSVFIYNVLLEDLNKKFEIQFDEVSNMRCYSLSILFLPVQKEWILIEVPVGIACNRAVNSQFNKVDYSYSLVDDKFNYLYKDYKLVERTHLGYQAGINITFYPLPNIGLQISSKIQDLSNGGTFFLVGAGLKFKF
jgi:hypothetical protein